MNRMVMSLFFTVSLSTLAFASGTPTDTMENNNPQTQPSTASAYDQGVKASQDGDFQKALPLFQQALQADPNNPDVLNMLAHTQRKLGMFDAAVDNYKKALGLRPKFPEAREYLGEAYIDAAMHEAETLKSYGPEGREQLEDLTKDFKEAAEKL
jgi:Tfp pilus assembly protein PilF